MMSQPALCPSCKRDVVFDISQGASWCPSCGARFELAAAAPARPNRLRWFHPLVFLAWMFLPALVALIVLHVVSTPKAPRWDRFFEGHTAIVIGWVAVTAMSSIGASVWFTGRFTRRTWLKITLGLCLGLGILICNAVIAFFGSCAMMPGSM